MNRTLYPRALGALTAAYGLYTLARPQSLIRATELTEKLGPASKRGRRLGQVVGVRDTLVGLAMITAPQGKPLQSAVAARVAADAIDFVGFGLTVPPHARGKVAAVTSGWAAVCATSWKAAA